jgi:ABC-2 type transport system ATP-binding protein
MPVSDRVIALAGITRSYPSLQGGKRLRLTALDGIDLVVEQGELFGLVGPNGSGKTTLAKILSGMLCPHAGRGTVNGHDLIAGRRQIQASTTLIKSGGWTGMLHHSTLRDNIRDYGLLAGVAPRTVAQRTEGMLRLLELEDKAGALPWHLSAGQRQKLCLAMAGMVRTPLVILDEPTTHLDPLATQDVRWFIRHILNQERGQTVLLATHYLDEAEALCDRVAFLDRGRVIACGTPAELAARAHPGAILELALQGRASPLDDALSAIVGVREVRSRLDDPSGGRWRIRVYHDGGAANPTSAVLAKLSSEGTAVRWVRTVQPSLYDAYHALVGGQLAW